MLIESVGDEAIPESTFVVVEGWIHYGPIDEDKFTCVLVPVEDGRLVFHFFGEVTIVDIQLFHFFPVVAVTLLLLLGKLMERHLYNIHLCLYNRTLNFQLDLVVFGLLGLGLDLFGVLLIVKPIGLEYRNQLGVKLLGKETQV